MTSLELTLPRAATVHDHAVAPLPRPTPAGGIEQQRIAPSSTLRRGVPRIVRRTTGPVLLVALWYALSVSGMLPSEVLAGPQTVLSSAAALWASGELPDAILISLQRTLLGLAIGGSA
ncbi:MAG: hypothetical protein RSB42_06405, partial [Comamonas sp.]